MRLVSGLFLTLSKGKRYCNGVDESIQPGQVRGISPGAGISEKVGLNGVRREVVIILDDDGVI